MKKGFGIFFIVIGTLNIIIGIAGLGSEFADKATPKIFIGIGLLGLGIWMVSSAKTKKQKGSTTLPQERKEEYPTKEQY